MATLPRSVNAIKAFQARYGLVVDGVFGPQSRRAWREANTPPKKNARREPDKSAMQSTLFAPAAASGPLPTYTSNVRLLVTARRIDEIIFHCIATPEGRDFDIRDVAAWHKQRGWDRPGYHYLILRNGTIQLGCPVGQEGIHTKGHNRGTIGVAYVGGLTTDGKNAKDTRTPAQHAAALWLCAQLKQLHGVKRRVSGHNEYAQKACPSFIVARDRLGQAA